MTGSITEKAVSTIITAQACVAAFLVVVGMQRLGASRFGAADARWVNLLSVLQHAATGDGIALIQSGLVVLLTIPVMKNFVLTVSGRQSTSVWPQVLAAATLVMLLGEFFWFLG